MFTRKGTVGRLLDLVAYNRLLLILVGLRKPVVNRFNVVQSLVSLINTIIDPTQRSHQRSTREQQCQEVLLYYYPSIQFNLASLIFSDHLPVKHRASTQYSSCWWGLCGFNSLKLWTVTFLPLHKKNSKSIKNKNPSCLKSKASYFRLI